MWRTGFAGSVGGLVAGGEKPNMGRLTMPHSRQVLVAILLLSAVCLAPAHAANFITKPFGVNVTPDITYATINLDGGGTADLKLDLYEPTGANVPATKPGLLVFHGGGFAVNSKAGDATEFPPSSGNFINSSITDYAMAFAQRGYVVVSVDYPKILDYSSGADYAVGTGYLTTVGADLAATAARTNLFLDLLMLPNLPQVNIINTIEAAYQSAVDVEQWMTANSGSLGVDPNRIAIGGWSAGAGIAFNAANAGANVAAAWLNSGGSAVAPAVVDVNTPPMIQFHGDVDNFVAIAGGRAIRDALIAQGTTHQFFEMAGIGHFYFTDTLVTAAPSRAVPDTVENLIAEFMFSELNLEPISTPLPATDRTGLFLLVTVCGLLGVLMVNGTLGRRLKVLSRKG